jgi:hypothetical protein
MQAELLYACCPRAGLPVNPFENVSPEGSAEFGLAYSKPGWCEGNV